MIVPECRRRVPGRSLRRVMAVISNNEDARDISTLANPEIVDEIRKMRS
jgi:acetyl-CoA synthetase